MVKRSRKVILYVIGFLLLLGLIVFLASNEKRPTVQPTEEADALAKKMLLALNAPAWDSTQVLTWRYATKHTHVWDKKNGFIAAIWDDIKVVQRTDDWHIGKVFKNNQEITGKEANKKLEKAWSLFCNNSFWLIAPYKAFDAGTKRSIVKDEKGNAQLLVSYESGGVTPGDAYLWQLDKDFRPISYKMWVKIIPIGGVKASWDSWKTSETGAMYPTEHALGFLNLPVENVKMGNSLSEINIEANLFDSLK